MHIKADYQGSHPLRVVQLSDSHLGENSDTSLLGMNTEQSLGHVLEMLAERENEIDLMLVTGDIALHGAREAYENLLGKLQRFAFPSVWLAGNHDDPAKMRDVVADRPLLNRRVVVGGWQIVLLDSVIAGEVGGKLAGSELQFLQHCLQSHPGQPTIVAMHHHPVPVGCDWLDEQRVSNAGALHELLADHSQVKAVCFGHVHQDFDHTERNIRFLATPSTCVQFASNSSDFKLAALAPGVRLLDLHTNGQLDTEVLRLQGIELAVDIDSAGYAQDDD